MQILGIVGSPRKEGNSAYLLNNLLENLKGSFDTELLYLKDYEIKPCRECYYCVEHEKCSINDGMQEIYPKLKEVGVILLSSPVFMGGITSRLRAFMERMWHLRKGQLQGKLGSYIIVGRRDIGASANEMEEFLSRLQVNKLPGVIGYALHNGDIQKDEEALKAIKKLGNQILTYFEV
jgi:multimeric flavodoxin WrbA